MPNYSTDSNRKAFDPFEAADVEGYSVDNFYVKSTNQHDHDENVRLHVAKEQWAVIQQIIQSRTFPAYRSPHDVMRDALAHRIRYLAPISEKDGHVIEGWENQAALEEVSRVMEQVQLRLNASMDMIESVRQTIDLAIKHEALEELEAAIGKGEATMDLLRGMPTQWVEMQDLLSDAEHERRRLKTRLQNAIQRMMAEYVNDESEVEAGGL